MQRLWLKITEVLVFSGELKDKREPFQAFQMMPSQLYSLNLMSGSLATQPAMFPQGHLVSIVIKYGKPLKRELKIKDGETESIFYNPQCHDLLIYNRDSDDISVRTDGEKGQLPEYLRCIGKHIFGSESYFEEKKIFSLDKLHEIQTASHNFASVDGIEDVKLVELQYDWGGKIEIRKSGNLLGTLIRKNGLESTSKANIIYAKFSIRFEGSNTPCKVDIRSGNQATFGRDEDSLVIEDWINDQLNHSKKPKTGGSALCGTRSRSCLGMSITMHFWSGILVILI